MSSPIPPRNAQSLFEAEKLQAPPVPAHLAALLRPDGAAVLATRPLKASPYDLGYHLDEFAADPELASYAVVGFAGHGINSWAAHCYIVDDGLALFIQLPWGGAYLDPEPARSEIADLFHWATLLQSKLTLARQLALVPEGRWLQVAASSFSFAGWRWLDPGVDRAGVPWNAAAGMRATLQQTLDDMLGDKRAL